MNPADPPDIHAFFVYGTLQRGGCREPCWPCAPISIVPATTRALMRDLGPYPGLEAGTDTIGGELWRLRPEDVPRTLDVLDEVEGATGGEDAWYERRAVECRTADGRMVSAWCYFFAHPVEIEAKPRVEADEYGVCRWRPRED
jgi:gamma-glutamylcyclotransferase (GGCT)/AIG2-like uncharacterized protein YtfP